MANDVLEAPTKTVFSHVKEGDTPWRSGGLRDFFRYRDLGIADATGGQVIAQLVRANDAARPKAPAGTATRRISTSSSCSRAGRASCMRTR